MSLFPVHSVDRALSRWEEHLHEITPVERRGGIWLKREDLFAPLGPGGINGGKVRTTLWVLSRSRRPGVVYGGSVRSPQLARVAVVAHHLGLRCTEVIGSALSSAVRHQEVAIAAAYGAEFVRSTVAYNPALQRRAQEEAAHRGYEYFEYGASLDSATRGESFVHDCYHLAAEQVANVPAEIETIYAPAGTCNAAVGLLYGLSLHPPPCLRRVVLVGVGPNRTQQLAMRLDLVRRVSGRPLNISHAFGPVTPDQAGGWDLEYVDLHAAGVRYEDEYQESIDQVVLHPVYEAKVWRYMRSVPARGPSLLWIVGGDTEQSVMLRHAPRGFT